MSEEKTINPELEELKKEINVLKGKLTTLESNKKTIEEEAEELVGKVIYERKRELERSYNEILKEAEQRLKATEKEKQDERKKNIDNLVKEKTKSTRESNIYLKNHINNILSENKLPFFVNSSFYMGVWNPTSVKEKLIAAISVIVVLAIPTIISFGISKDNLIKAFPNAIFRSIIIVLIYFGVIFIAGLIWLLVDKLTRKNINVINEIKEIRKDIEDNNKEIAKITKETNNEATDDRFDYTKLDRMIEAGKIEVENYKTKRENAINHFDTVTVEEIKAKAKSEVENKTRVIVKEIEKVKEEIESLQRKYDDLRIKLVE